MTTLPTLQASLDAVAEADIDIVPVFFDRFFAAHLNQRDGFNRPLATQGAMVSEMIRYLVALEAGEGWVLEAIDATVAKHHSYGDISSEVFDDALDILIQTLALVAADRWTPQFTAIWKEQADRMKSRIQEDYPAHAVHTFCARKA